MYHLRQAVVATELNESDLERAKGPISEGLGCSMNSGSRGIGGVFRKELGQAEFRI
jgi:hypothetical protein